MPPIPPAVLALMRRNAEQPDAYVVTIAAGDLRALLAAYDRVAADAAPAKPGVVSKPGTNR